MDSGDVLALVAAVLFALAAALQQRGSMGIEAGGGGMSATFFIDLLARPVWLLGTGALIVGYLVQAAALSLGRLVVIQPLLVTTVVFALPMGMLISHQVVTGRDWAAGAGVVVALAVFVVVGDPASGRDDAPGWQWALALLIVVGVSVLGVLLAHHAVPVHRAALLGAVAGILFGISASLAKPVVEELGDRGVEAMLSDWRAWALAGAGISAFLIQQGALAVGQLAPAVAATSLANPVVASIVGVVVLDESLAGGLGRRAVAVGALVAAAAFAIVLAQHAQPPHGTGPEDGVPVAPSLV